MKVFLIGGTGILGREIKKIDSSIISVGSDFYIYSFEKLEKKMNEHCKVVKHEMTDHPGFPAGLGKKLLG